MSESSTLRVKFHIVYGADSADKKTSIPLVYSIQIEDIFVFPWEFQPLRIHSELLKFSAIAAVARTLKTREKYRKIIVPLTNEQQKEYFDKDGNARFNGEYLEDLQSAKNVPAQNNDVSNPFGSLQTITKDAVIVQFNGSSPNATTWINTFEKECDRLLIDVPNRCIALRLFLDSIAKDWYQTTFILLGAAT